MKKPEKALIPSSPPESKPLFSLTDAKADAQRLINAFLSSLSPNTLRAYKRSLEEFRIFLETKSIHEAASKFFSKTGGEANAIILSYKNHLVGKGKSPGTVNARLAAVKSLTKLARTLGVISWSIEIKGYVSQTYRDTRGPGREAFDKVVAELEMKDDPVSKRDLALLRLLHDAAFRRGEAAAVDIQDFDPKTGIISFRGKGRHEDETFSLPMVTQTALKRWIEATGRKAGPIFSNFDLSKKGQKEHRLTGSSIYRIVRFKYGLVRPHGLRHTAITEALDLTGGNIRAVQKFSRHRDVRVIERYDDNRQDMGGQIAKKLARET